MVSNKFNQCQRPQSNENSLATGDTQCTAAVGICMINTNNCEQYK